MRYEDRMVRILSLCALGLFAAACGDDGIKSKGASCGDQSCNGDETCASCASDCGVCGTDCATLAQKCPECDLASLKSACEAAVASGDEASCRDALDDNDVQTRCPPEASVVCGDGTCNGNEACASCPQDCGACPAGAACTALAAICPQCPATVAGILLKATCEAAVATGDEDSCQDGLDDPDIQASCAS